MKIDAILAGMLKDQAELAAMAVLVQQGVLKRYLTQNQAHTIYGRGVVERWVKEALVTLIKDGTKNAPIRIDRMQLEAVSKVSNRPSYQSLGNEY
jgi:hypothetical protein